MNTILPDSVAELLKNTRPTSEIMPKLKAAAKKLDRDSDFVAECAKAQVVEDVYRAFEEMGLNKNQLAQRMGRSRQYLSRVVNETTRSNFTIDTLAEISTALDWRLIIRMLPRNEMVKVETVVKQSAQPMADFTAFTNQGLVQKFAKADSCYQHEAPVKKAISKGAADEAIAA